MALGGKLLKGALCEAAPPPASVPTVPALRAGEAGSRTPEAPKLRPKVCRQYMSSGTCSYGDRCQFSHNPDDDPRGAPGVRPWDCP